MWAARALWLLLPFTAFEAIERAVPGVESAPRQAVLVCAWLMWGCCLVSFFVARPEALVAARLGASTVALGSIVATIWPMFDAGNDRFSTLGAIGTALAIIAAGLLWLPAVGEWYLNGAAYGDERRMGLRCPAPIAMATPILWVFGLPAVVVGVALVADGSVPAGLLVAALGAVVTVWGFIVWLRAANRFVVFVPTGVTVVDELTLEDSVLTSKARLRSIGPAVDGTRSFDTTAGAAGLQVDIGFLVPTPITVRNYRTKVSETIEVAGLRIAPSRPGAVLAEAAGRKLPIA